MSLVIRTTGIEDYLDGGNANIKALIMGQPGSGKTRSSAFWPKPILADCEQGRMAVADKAMPYAEITCTADMDALLRMLALECQKPVASRRFLTFVLDTLDAYQRLCIQERLNAEHKESLSGWADWGYLDGKMQQLVAKLQALPMNIVVNLHVKDKTVQIDGGSDDDEATKITVIGPKLKGDLREQIAAEFDLVGYMGTYWEAVDGERQLLRGIQWWPDPTHPILKDRSGQLPRWTPVVFTEDDHGNLLGHLAGQLDNLAESTELQTLETDPVVTHAPVPPTPGGPVTPVETPRKAAAPAAAPPAATPVAQVATPVAEPVSVDTPDASTATPQPATPAVASSPPTAVVTAPIAAAPPPVATKPVISGAEGPPAVSAPIVAAVAPLEPEAPAEQPAEAAVTPEEGVAAAVEGLGAEVISEPPAAEPAPTDAPAVAAPVEQAGTVVAAAAPAVEDRTTLVCGTPWLPEGETPDGFVPVPGCGKTNLDEEPNPALVEIAQLKTRTNLCNACFSAHRAAK